MPAQKKSELLEVTAKEYAKLLKLIAPLGPEEAKRTLDGVSVKDIIGHRARWIDLFLGWYDDGQAGREVAFPAEGYKWNELNRYNADLRKEQADLSWNQVNTLLDDRAVRLTEFLESKTNEDLYGGPMRGAKNDWTAGRWAEAAGASHFRSAAKFIRAAMKE
ncbi:ClbS/DfsB family four-helix bundle protein [Litoreibacter roseus]|uniref:ClbS/DfsB family four-helix bundle protein n=1 Tax=Litoreibacter roseus TaxID=2601869 RepID=A0A6N6JH90_9RHOB|nr:ClbS/DfsB family four-helix bundle protein [Litoreibacter roseus]GFE65485.1 hypothetical protein KIN_25590 [Litoreibacter roseus]